MITQSLLTTHKHSSTQTIYDSKLKLPILPKLSLHNKLFHRSLFQFSGTKRICLTSIAKYAKTAKNLSFLTTILFQSLPIFKHFLPLSNI